MEIKSDPNDSTHNKVFEEAPLGGHRFFEMFNKIYFNAKNILKIEPKELLLLYAKIK